MTLNNLLGVSLDSVEPDAASIQRLLEAAQASLADAQLPKLSSEGRFDMAYKAIMQTANAALQANGFRTLTSKSGHHQTMSRRCRVPLASIRPRWCCSTRCVNSGMSSIIPATW